MMATSTTTTNSPLKKLGFTLDYFTSQDMTDGIFNHSPTD
jgi:hypothetical protein